MFFFQSKVKEFDPQTKQHDPLIYNTLSPMVQ